MNTISIKNKINLLMKEKEGSIFVTSDFYDLGNKSTIKDALFRLTKDDIIHRLIDGFYTIPKYSEIINEYSYPSPDQLANKIAEKYSWKICPYGETVLNLFGFSTQVSANYSYISDGPYRDYNYRGRVITFKHTNNRNITMFSKELSSLIQVIKAIGKDNITEDVILELVKYCKKNVKEDILNDTKQITAWIHDVLKKISEVEKNE